MMFCFCCYFVPETPDYIELTNMDKIIELVRDNPNVGFLYLTPAVPKSSVYSHYYNLK